MSSNEIVRLSKQAQWLQATDLMTDLTQRFKTADHRLSVAATVLEDILKCLSETLTVIQAETNSSHPTDVSLIRYTTEIFRCLRNASAGCPQNQNVIGSNATSMTNTHSILDIIRNDSSPDSIPLQKCGLQFIGNVSVGNSQNQKLVCQSFLGLFRELLRSPDNGVVNYTCMVLHNCLLSQDESTTSRQLPAHLNFTDNNFSAVIMIVLQATVLRDLEWGLYVMEDLLQISDFLGILYARLSQTEQLFVVEVLITMLKKTEECSGDRKEVVALDNLTFLASEVKSQSRHILQAGLIDADHSQAPFLLVKILEGLGLATSLHSLYGSFQEDTELLVSCLNLLHGIHAIGLQGDNHFTSVEKVSDMDLIDKQHPAFGLKRDLIRLIANLVYRHRDNQNKVRELDGIPLILDQSNMDGRNPFITQWVVLAVRNLCEDNAENKQYLAGMRLEGMANNVEALREFGVRAEISGDKIIVKPPDEP